MRTGLNVLRSNARMSSSDFRIRRCPQNLMVSALRIFLMRALSLVTPGWGWRARVSTLATGRAMGDLGDGVPVASSVPGGPLDIGDGPSESTERGVDSAATTAAATAAASSTAAVEPLPTIAGTMAKSSEAGAAGASDSPPAVPETATATVFRMDDDDGDALENDSAEALLPTAAAPEPAGPESSDHVERPPGGSLGQEDGAGAAAVVPPDSELAQEVRRRFQWLNSKDQKTTVRRECYLAEKREAGLAAQLQRTIDVYVQALEMNRLANTLDDGQGPILSAEAVIKYEERIEFLRGTIAVLEAEPAVSLPQLSALETTKGFVFDSYARTAQSVKHVGDQTGMSEPVVNVASNAVTGARAAFASLSSMVRRRTSSDASVSSADGNVATVASFLSEPEADNSMGSAASSSSR
mmetsp:Transcript_97629/g.170475  ORF Transcript_97629/g.170475 Transcript_97629/m.170475 type:complete len:411 (+) Transcript_97629:60-1292(+)